MTKVLAIDAATEACSIALLDDDKVYYEGTVAPQSHTKLLLPMVEKMLKDHDLSLGELDAIACGMGPGSFTGVRIGVSMAHGLAFGAEKPLIGVVNLEAMAYESCVNTGKEYAVVAIDARMGEVYIGIYKLVGKELTKCCQERVCPPNEALELIKNTLKTQDFCYAGTGIAAYQDTFNEVLMAATKAENDLPRADSIAKLASIKMSQDPKILEIPVEEIQPLYLRDTVTWKKVTEQ